MPRAGIISYKRVELVFFRPGFDPELCDLRDGLVERHGVEGESLFIGTAFLASRFGFLLLA